MVAQAGVVLLALLLVPAVAGVQESPVLRELSSSQFSGFVKLLELCDLVPEIDAAVGSARTQGVTVFAPTDDALLYHTSPTLLAFLKLSENRDTLRQVLLSHFVAEKLSPFQWEGARKTLAGSDLALTMDSQAFYANSVAVTQYNVVVGRAATVHSVPTLLIPARLAASAEMFVEEGNEVRRALLGDAPAPAPAGLSIAPPTAAPKAAAPASVATPIIAAAAAIAAAVLL